MQQGGLFAVIALLSTAAAAQPHPQRIIVLELSSALTGAERKELDAAYLTERIRDVTLEVMPRGEYFLIDKENMLVLLKASGKTLADCEGECEVDTGRRVGADLVVSGRLQRFAGQYRITLRLSETAEGSAVNSVLAAGDTAAALEEDLRRVTALLFAPLLRKSTGGAALLQMTQGVSLPAVSQLTGNLASEGKGLDLSNTDALVARDRALEMDKSGKEHPDDAAKAWQALADVPGSNPFRKEAAGRAAEWRAFAEKKAAYDKQFASDTGNLRKLLPLRSVPMGVKTQLLVEYQRKYGQASPHSVEQLLGSIEPSEAREEAESALRCEAKDASSCMSLAKIALAQGDTAGAMDSFDRACGAGSTEGCEELGMRADKTRAGSALQKACSAGRGHACARLAASERDPAQAARLTEEACNGRDAGSCLKLADASKDAARAAQLRQKACDFGDQPTCARIRAEEDRANAARIAAENKAAAERAAREQALAAENDKESRRHTGWLLNGIGGASALACGFFLYSGSKQNDTIKSGGFATKADLQSAVDKGKTYNTIALATGIASAALIGVGTIFVVSNSASEVKVAAAPGGMVIAGRFP